MFLPLSIHGIMDQITDRAKMCSFCKEHIKYRIILSRESDHFKSFVKNMEIFYLYYFALIAALSPHFTRELGQDAPGYMMEYNSPLGQMK